MPFANTAEGGTSGTTVTTGNSGGGSGDAFSAITGPGTAGIIEFTNVQKAHGNLGYRYATRGTSEAVYFAWDNGTGVTGTTFGRLYVRYDNINAGTKLVHWRPSSTGLALGYIQLSSAGVVQLRDGTDATTVWTGPTLSADTWYRIEWSIDASGSAAQSTVEVNVYAGDNTSTVASGASGAQTVTNAGPANTNVGYIRYGLAVAGSNRPSTTGFIYLDDLTAFDTSFPGPQTTGSQFMRPSADSVVGSYTNQAGSSTNIYQSIDEVNADDSDYIQSPLSPSNAPVRLKLGTGVTPAAGSRTFRWRVAKDVTGGNQIDATAKIYQGGGNVQGAGTLKETFTHTNVTTATTFTETVTATITDYSDLYVEFSANQV